MDRNTETARILVLLALTLSAHVRAADEVDAVSPLVTYYFGEQLDPIEGQPNIVSPLTSFHFHELNVPIGDQPNIVSPLTSYLFFEAPTDDTFEFSESSPVSFLFHFGEPFSLSGQVTNSLTGAPVAGASVTFRRYTDVFAETTTDAIGIFQAANLLAQSYTIEVSAPGYVRQVANFNGEVGGHGSASFCLTPLPAPFGVEESDQAPAGTAIGTPDTGGSELLVLSDGPLDPARMTVVMTHGWISNSSAWALAMASDISRRHRLGDENSPNIVAWDWRVAAKTPLPSPEAAVAQGEALGRELHRLLGSDYAKHIHFIGHSMGTIVNAYACDFAHAGFDRASNNPPSGWDFTSTRPHITLLDEAEMASLAGQNVLTTAATSAKYGLANFLARTGLRAVKDWKDPIPEDFYWIDNYISAVGLDRPEAVNVCLPAVALATGNPVTAHAYAHQFYRNTVNPAEGPATVGFDNSIEGGATIPPIGTGLTPNSLWFENLATPDPLDLSLDGDPKYLECSGEIVSAFVVIGIPTAVGPIGQLALDSYERGIELVGEVGGDIIISTGDVLTEFKETIGTHVDAAVDRAADILNSINPAASLPTILTSPTFAITLISRAGRARDGSNEPAYAWMTVEVPPDAVAFQFDFQVDGDPADDLIACAVDDLNVFTLPARFAPDGSPVSTDLIDIQQHAGQTVELFFGLHGGTSADCALTIEGIRFITIPMPTMGIVDLGDSVVIKWPTAAVGWIPECSNSLDSGWEAFPTDGAVVYQSGIATIELPKAEARKFWRLRRLD